MNYEKYLYNLIEIVIEDNFISWYVYFIISLLFSTNKITVCEYKFLYSFIHSISINHDLVYLEYTD